MPLANRCLALVPLMLLVSCATARIDSNLRRGYTKTLDRIYVVMITSSSASRDFVREIQAPLSQKLTQAGVVNAVHFYDNLNLDEKASIKREVGKLKPHFLMEISQTSRSTVNGGAAGATFELSLSETGDETLIWKAELRTGGGMAPREGSGDTTAQEIVDQLIKDGLIKSPAVAPAHTTK